MATPAFKPTAAALDKWKPLTVADTTYLDKVSTGLFGGDLTEFLKKCAENPGCDPAMYKEFTGWAHGWNIKMKGVIALGFQNFCIKSTLECTRNVPPPTPGRYSSAAGRATTLSTDAKVPETAFYGEQRIGTAKNTEPAWL